MFQKLLISLLTPPKFSKYLSNFFVSRHHNTHLLALHPTAITVDTKTFISPVSRPPRLPPKEPCSAPAREKERERGAPTPPSSQYVNTRSEKFASSQSPRSSRSGSGRAVVGELEVGLRALAERIQILIHQRQGQVPVAPPPAVGLPAPEGRSGRNSSSGRTSGCRRPRRRCCCCCCRRRHRRRRWTRDEEEVTRSARTRATARLRQRRRARW